MSNSNGGEGRRVNPLFSPRAANAARRDDAVQREGKVPGKPVQGGTGSGSANGARRHPLGAGVPVRKPSGVPSTAEEAGETGSGFIADESLGGFRRSPKLSFGGGAVDSEVTVESDAVVPEEEDFVGDEVVVPSPEPVKDIPAAEYVERVDVEDEVEPPKRVMRKSAPWNLRRGDEPVEDVREVAPRVESDAERKQKADAARKIFLGSAPPVRKPKDDALVPAASVERAEEAPAAAVKPAVDEDGYAPFQKKPEHLIKDTRLSVRKPQAQLIAADWDDEDSEDWEKRAAVKDVPAEIGTGFHLTDRDITIIRFLAKYRYAYNHQVARRVDASVKAVRTRLRTLEKKGFVSKQPVSGSVVLWMSTKAGNLVADVDSSVTRKTDWSWPQVPHTVGLTNIGIELEIGGDNLLKEAVHPQENRLGLRGEWLPGERVISEKEIRSASQKWRMNRTTEQMYAMVSEAVADTGPLETLDNGNMVYRTPPEGIEGNEGLFVVYAATGEHVPDQVVVRPRDVNGLPQNIAIELELNEKPISEWRRILRAYRDYGHMYSKVVYFTHKTTIANQLRKVNENDVKLPPERFMVRKYVPAQGREPFWG